MVKTSSIFENNPLKKMFRNSKIEKEKLIDLKSQRDERFELRELGWYRNFILGSVACGESVLFLWLKKVPILEFSTPKSVILTFFSQVQHAV